MKKNYMAPEADFLALITEDILTISAEPTEPTYDADGTHGTEITL